MSTRSESSVSGQRPLLAFGFAVPIAMLGGLIGLGGAEFRLPVLVGPLHYSAKQAVPLNLAVSLITVIASLLIRANTLSLTPLRNISTIMLALIAGAIVAAFFGVALAQRISEQRLEQVILVLLVGIGIALLVEAFVPQQSLGFVPDLLIAQIIAGILFGLAIGMVSSLLGVAGGELIIPTLIFAFGVEIKIAGTASLLISLPTIIVGLVRYARRGAFAERGLFRETIIPMGIGSVIGALIGGAIVGIVSAQLLKFVLGAILIVSAVRIFHQQRRP